jgi:hypothetical protein
MASATPPWRACYRSLDRSVSSIIFISAIDPTDRSGRLSQPHRRAEERPTGDQQWLARDRAQSQRGQPHRVDRLDRDKNRREGEDRSRRLAQDERAGCDREARQGEQPRREADPEDRSGGERSQPGAAPGRGRSGEPAFLGSQRDGWLPQESGFFQPAEQRPVGITQAEHPRQRQSHQEGG